MARTGGPGSAPPIREVPEGEVQANIGLVHYVLDRMRRKGQIAASMEEDDLFQIGAWGLWEALRRWQPEKARLSTYCTSYIWGYVMKQQRDITKADGWHRTDGRLATVVSYEQEIVEDFTVLDTLAAPDDTAEAAEWTARMSDLEQRLARMPDKHQVIGERILAGLPATAAPVSDSMGISRARAGQIAKRVYAGLTAERAAPRRGVLLVHRELHPDRDAAIREARRIRPGCEVLSVSPRKWRKGRVVAAQGRPAKDGSLGIPVWAVELRDAA